MPQPILNTSASSPAADLVGPHNHPEISMHSHPFAEYVKCICANDWAGVAELMLSSSQKP
jgi:aspartate racemase